MNRRGTLLRAVVMTIALVGGPVSVGAGTAGAESVVVLHPDAAAFAEHLDISVEEANERLQLEPVIGSMHADAQRLWGDTYAGTWIDHAAGGRINVAFTADAAKHVGEMKRSFPRPEKLHPVLVPRSMAELEAELTRMVADREEVRAGRLSFPGVDGVRYDMKVDVARNAVVVVVDDEDPRTRGAFASRYGQHVIVEATGVAEPTACTRADCRHSLRSGLRAESTNGWCTLAFAVSGGILSAAHCPDTARQHAFTSYGSVTANSQINRADAERHSVSLNGFHAGAYLWVSSSETARRITSVGLWGNLVVGASACKSGITTGTDCGVVQNTNVSVHWVPSSTRFVQADYCSDPGDSGSGVYSGNQALGINSGGANVTCSASDYGLFGHIEYAQSQLGVTVLTSESAATFSSITAGAAGTSTITARFSKPVVCSTVSTGDFTANVNGTVNLTVTGVSCSADSDSTVDLTVNVPLVTATTVNVSVVGSILNPPGSSVPGATRSDTV